MLSLFSPKKDRLLHINDSGRAIEVKPKETILQAALGAGIDFPNNCRVGGCATCKCKLTQGAVRELTESSYVLSEQELAEGYILACQSTPRGDVSISVDLQASRSNREARRLPGTIVRQWKLTADITGIEIELAETLTYVAGQYANLSLAGDPTIFRSYSFATAPGSDRRVSFFVREVTGGALSPVINRQDLVGRDVELEGPLGDFRLRKHDGSLLFVAGGSGLAPIKAMLEQALADGDQRDAVFLFGARSQAELYCTNEIRQLAAAWPGSFRFVPVLSEEPRQSSWSGERGLVTEAIAGAVTGTEQAYLCGPPGMIDAALRELQLHGIPAGDIYFDKFYSQADLKAA